ncbi:MAG: hypothetical protein WBC91_19810 [Phototrophicaceae bacterium]
MQGNQSLLSALVKELKAHIQCQEEHFAELVIADFEDRLVQSNSPVKTAYQWLKTYQSLR